jgi:hypothetical protein
MSRQSVFGRLAGYEDVNDAERLRRDPAMRWIVGGKAASGCAASASQIPEKPLRRHPAADRGTAAATDGRIDVKRSTVLHSIKNQGRGASG